MAATARVAAANRAIWEALAQGIKSADPNHLMTFHPPGGNGGRSSSEWFHQSDWLDFNLAQSGHERKHLANDEIVTRDYDLQPVKPCLDGEPRYEDHPVNWRPQELGWFDDYDVRQAAYWAVFAGALAIPTVATRSGNFSANATHRSPLPGALGGRPWTCRAPARCATCGT